MNKKLSFKIRNNAVRILCAFMALMLLIPFAGSLVSAFDALIEVSEPVERSSSVIVSLGDSYSSGEGIEPFYGQNAPYSEKSYDSDWLAHRSELSWSGRLTLPDVDGTMASNRGTNWFFVASSGATTYHMKNHQFKETSSSIYDGETHALDPQLNVFNNMGNKRADYVTVTIGGNDVGFSDIITTAVASGKATFWNPNKLQNQINGIWNDFYKSIRGNIKKAYKDIAEAAGKQASIIVAGYPQLLSSDGGGGVFSEKEAGIINDAVHKFNNELEKLVAECRSEGLDIYFVDVEEAFSGHEAYTDHPYINPVYPGTKSEDLKWVQLASSYSVHPNSDGAKAYARCVQAKINEIEEIKHPKRETSDERDTVLVLDISSSMIGNPIMETQKAADAFVSTVLKEDASIGIVTFSDFASMNADFSKNESFLKNVISLISTYGATNTESGLARARELLSNSTAKKKIIVLMSDGEPNRGLVGDQLIEYADSLKDEGIIIYTLGFFSNCSSPSKAQKLMEGIASEGCHYEVDDASNLVFFFNDVADQITGVNYIYVRIACPVDVTVKYNGEVLCSKEDEINTRTSFGSLTFEDNPNRGSYETGVDNRIKVLRLKEGAKYDIDIRGTAEGSMNYTIGFMDSDGKYSDLREFNKIPIAKGTAIYTTAERASSSIMKIDSNGDGKIDTKLKAGKNGVGVPYKDFPWIAIIIALVLAAVVVLIVVLSARAGKRKAAIKYCRYCGFGLNAKATFCPKCGMQLRKTS